MRKLLLIAMAALIVGCRYHPKVKPPPLPVGPVPPLELYGLAKPQNGEKR